MNGSNLPSNRQFKVAELIKRTLAEILNKGKLLDLALVDVSVTVSEVRVNSDLRVAIVYIVPLFSYKVNHELVIQSLTKLTPVLRKMLTSKVKLKYSPELIFKFDDSFNNAQKISTLIDNAKIDQ
ncbi:Ribosome-binding factor A [Rickettsiales bacterium Ac37b]|nr:Ribosome-binding factor A [Rickettsiales bacterium Ac37b]